jgi:hypothetical protein
MKTEIINWGSPILKVAKIAAILPWHSCEVATVVLGVEQFYPACK